MAMILRNHGLLAVGRSIPEAFNQIYFLERACQA
ncbi:class II aldolase/adducin family protein [Paraburkholderia terrae]